MPPAQWFDKTKKTPDIDLLEFVQAYKENDAIWFRLGCGAQKQLFDKILEEVFRLEREGSPLHAGQGQETKGGTEAGS